MPMRLRLGVMTNMELAKWFGVSEKTFKNYKYRYVEELKEYATFENYRGKVNITSIKLYEHVPKKSRSYNKIKDSFEDIWSDNCYDTCARVNKVLLRDYHINLQETTSYNYTLKAKDELYGKAFGEGGEHGKCIYVYCKQRGEGAEAVYIPFTPEETKIKNRILKKYYGSTDEKMAIVDRMILNKEISKEEAYEALSQMIGGNPTERYFGFKIELEKELGCKIQRVTYLEKKPN